MVSFFAQLKFLCLKSEFICSILQISILYAILPADTHKNANLFCEIHFYLKLHLVTFLQLFTTKPELKLL